jgi:uncharacterized protein (TIGR02594 family)
MTELSNAIPWVALLVVFSVMGLLNWRLINALDHALSRSQADPVPAPAPRPIIVPPQMQTPLPAHLNPDAQRQISASVPVPTKPSGSFVGAPPWFQWALHEIGTREGPGNTGPELARYAQLAHCGSQGDAWCAIFANAALEAVAIVGSRSASSQSFRSHPGFVQLPGPALGAIVVFWRGSPDSGLGHVGFYRGEDATRIWTLGGNEADMVQIEALPKSGVSFGLVGYWWPKSAPLPAVGPLMMPSGSPTSIQALPAATIAPPSSGGTQTRITATYFGGPKSAYDGGRPIDDNVPGVALPHRFEGPRPRVRVTNCKTGASVDCDIVDVGPWNTHDPYWETNSRPQAETGVDTTGRKTNSAGIDLTLAAAKAIQIDGKGLVDWCFLQSPTTNPKVT